MGPAREAAAPRRRDFPGWRMVWALSVTETVSYGVLYYSFAVFLVPMREELEASTAQVSGALTLSLALSGLGAVVVGRWLDRFGARWVMAGGSLLGGASVVAWSQAQDLPSSTWRSWASAWRALRSCTSRRMR